MADERRQYERIAIRADALLRRNGHAERLSAQNLSCGGAYLVTSGADELHIELKTGGHFELTLTVDEDAPHHAFLDGSTVHAHARIVRRDPGGDGRPAGVAVAFEHVDLENLARIQALVGHSG